MPFHIVSDTSKNDSKAVKQVLILGGYGNGPTLISIYKKVLYISQT